MKKTTIVLLVGLILVTLVIMKLVYFNKRLNLSNFYFKDILGTRTPLGLKDSKLYPNGDKSLILIGLVNNIYKNKNHTFLNLYFPLEKNTVLAKVDVGFQEFGISEKKSTIKTNPLNENSKIITDQYGVRTSINILFNKSLFIGKTIEIELPTERGSLETISECKENCKKNIRFIDEYIPHNKKLGNKNLGFTFFDKLLGKNILLGAPRVISLSN